MECLVNASELQNAFFIDFLDISDRRCPDNIGKLDLVNVLLGIKQALQCLGRLAFKRPSIVYLGISQGVWGFLRDLTFILPAVCFRRKLVLHLRGSEFRTFYNEMPRWLKWLTRMGLDRAARVIVLGHGLRGVFDELVDPGKIAVIPNGIDYRRFEQPATEAGAPKSGKRLLYLSSLMKRKGLFLLLEALPLVFARHSDAEVSIAGLWQSDAERSEADALVKRLGLERRLKFLGEVNGREKVDLFHQHDVFVFTPIAPEGLPWVILEAMSASLPVVTTAQGAIAEVVNHDETGLIVTPAPDRVAEAICRLFQDRLTARAMGQRGHRRVTEHFSERAYLSKLIALFQEVAAQGKGELRTVSHEKATISAS